MPEVLQPLTTAQWRAIAMRNGWSGYGIAAAFCEAEMEADILAEEIERERQIRHVIIKAGSTFQGVHYFEDTKFDMSPELAAEMIAQGIARPVES